jgi:hypothetical protein
MHHFVLLSSSPTAWAASFVRRLSYSREVPSIVTSRAYSIVPGALYSWAHLTREPKWPTGLRSKLGRLTS